MAAFTMLLRLRQACLDLRLLGLKDGESKASREPASKVELLSELVGDAIEDGYRILVFSQFSSMLRLIKGRHTRIVAVSLQPSGNGLAEAIRVNLTNLFVNLFVPIFIPDRNA